MADEGENVIHRIRAIKELSETAKTLRLFLCDEEKYEEIEKSIRELEKRLK